MTVEINQVRKPAACDGSSLMKEENRLAASIECRGPMNVMGGSLSEEHGFGRRYAKSYFFESKRRAVAAWVKVGAVHSIMNACPGGTIL